MILDVSTTNTVGQWFGVHGGSAANLINRIQIIAKNGVVLERIDNANQLAASKINYAHSNSWKKSVGSLMGITSDGTASQLNWLSTGIAKQRFVIPLYVFSTLCDSMGSLCPSQLLAGARFEIQLETPSGSLLGATTGGTLAYNIDACRLEFESYLLTDSVMKVINQTAATQGLEVISATTQNTQSQRLSSQVVVDVARSCARALSVIYKERAPKTSPNLHANGYATGDEFDSMAAAVIVNSASGPAYVNTPLEWQVRAGQLYFPQSSIRATSSAISQAEVELYMQTLRAFQKLNPGSMGQNASSNTSLYEFRGVLGTTLGIGAQAVSGGNACFALDLQRSAILTSGIPLSNAHQLSINYNTNYTIPATMPYLVDVFLTYQVLIRTFLSQCVLEV